MLLSAIWAFGMITVGAYPMESSRITLKYMGQSCFLMTCPGDVRILMDPFDKLGYPPPAVEADIVTVSHEHFDHNNVRVVRGGPVVLRGLTADGGWNHIDETIKGVHIRTVGVYHDGRKGAKRGLNSVFIFETGGVKIVHLGDLGHTLDAKTVTAIGRPDFLMVPVGGFFTIDAEQAWEVVKQLQPAHVIPMHYRTDKTGDLPIQPLAPFLRGRKDVWRIPAPEIALEPSDKRFIWVFSTP